MPGKFKYIVAEQLDGVKHTFADGAGSTPITPALEAAVIAAATPPPPVIPILLKYQATYDEQRGDGIRNASAVNVQVKGFEQNIAVTNPGRFTFENVRTLEAWRSNVEEANEGQGLYLGGDNEVICSGFYAARNGWQKGKGLKAKNDRRHGLYANEGGSLVLEDFIFTENASCGVQSRRVSKIRRGFVHRNSIGILCLMQPQEIEDVVIYGGSWGVPNGGSGWVGMVGLDIYCPVKLRNVWIVGDGDLTPPGNLPGASRYDGGAVKCSRSHRQYPDTPGGSIDAADCVIAGWPGETGSKRWFSGDKPHDGTGFRPFVNPVTGLDAQVRAILADVENNKVPTIAGAATKLRELVRAAVK